MIAGAGVSMGGGAMLRTRRRDVSIKPNRKLDRKSSRGMIYENEELRLRTIHINAEVEQGQNDIKKLRRENEQLRREIWGLRDEYDKLEELLKKQKLREESDEVEDYSEASESVNSDSTDEEDEESTEEDAEEDKKEENVKKEEKLENTENQKICTENPHNGLSRLHVEFDGLSVVDEEDEPKKEKEQKEDVKKQKSQQCTYSIPTKDPNQDILPYYSVFTGSPVDNIFTPSYSFQSECPFIFPTPSNITFPNKESADNVMLLVSGCPPVYSNSLTTASNINSTDVQSTANTPFHSHFGFTGSPGNESSGTNTGLMALDMDQSPRSSESSAQTGSTVVLSPKTFSENMKQTVFGDMLIPGTKDDGVTTGDVTHSSIPNSASFVGHDPLFKDHSKIVCSSPVATNFENSEHDTTGNLLTKQMNGELTTISKKPKHFFAPLQPRLGSQQQIINNITQEPVMTSLGQFTRKDAGCSQTVDTNIVPESKYRFAKGSADIFIDNGFPTELANNKEEDHQKHFVSSEELFINSEDRSSKSSSNGHLMKSLSCHDLPTCFQNQSLSEKIKTVTTDAKAYQHAKSDNTLDASTAFRSQINVTLKNSDRNQPSSPSIPEMPQLPSFDSKLFSNQYRQRFQTNCTTCANCMMQGIKNPLNKPLTVQVTDSYNQPFSPGFNYYQLMSLNSPEIGKIGGLDKESASKKFNYEHLDQYKALLNTANLLDDKTKQAQDIQVTSFESPSPHTLPPMAPYDMSLLYNKIPPINPGFQGICQHMPILSKDAAILCPSGQGIKLHCDICTKKVPAQTQTSVEDSAKEDEDRKEKSNRQKKVLKREKSVSGKERRSSTAAQKRKDRLKKQVSVTSSDVPDTSTEIQYPGKTGASTTEEKNESHSSSSSRDSPRKERRRMSIYFNPRKRPSISSARTTRSLSLDINKARGYYGMDSVDSTNSDKEKINSVTVKENGDVKDRKASTSSGSVPWCACWGNGCI